MVSANDKIDRGKDWIIIALISAVSFMGWRYVENIQKNLENMATKQEASNKLVIEKMGGISVDMAVVNGKMSSFSEVKKSLENLAVRISKESAEQTTAQYIGHYNEVIKPFYEKQEAEHDRLNKAFALINSNTARISHLEEQHHGKK